MSDIVERITAADLDLEPLTCRSEDYIWRPAKAARNALAAAREEIKRLRAKADGWRPIESAPKDGTAFQARIPGHGSDNIIAWSDGLTDSNGNSCGGWSFASEQEPPDSWTDGVCWEVNEDGVASIKPTAWKYLPSPRSSHD